MVFEIVLTANILCGECINKSTSLSSLFSFSLSREKCVLNHPEYFVKCYQRQNLITFSIEQIVENFRRKMLVLDLFFHEFRLNVSRKISLSLYLYRIYLLHDIIRVGFLMFDKNICDV